jgi:hypothetical protein
MRWRRRSEPCHEVSACVAAQSPRVRIPELLIFRCLQGFYEWAMLGSNQRPPPCKLCRGSPTTVCPVRKLRLSERFSVFWFVIEFGCVRLYTAPVAARLQHAPEASEDMVRSVEGHETSTQTCAMCPTSSNAVSYSRSDGAASPPATINTLGF